MKRWDEVTFVKNLTVQAGTVSAQMRELMESTRLALLAGKEDVGANKLGAALEGLSMLCQWRDLTYDAVSGKYPMYGVDAWMLDGQCDNLRHRFEHGGNVEAVLMRCAQYLQAKVHRAGHRTGLPDGVKYAADALVACLTARSVPDSVYVDLIRHGVLEGLTEDDALKSMREQSYQQGFLAAQQEAQAQLDAEDAELAAAKQKLATAKKKKKAARQGGS